MQHAHDATETAAAAAAASLPATLSSSYNDARPQQFQAERMRENSRIVHFDDIEQGRSGGSNMRILYKGDDDASIDDEDLSEGFDAEHIKATTAKLRHDDATRRETASFVSAIQQAILEQQHRDQARRRGRTNAGFDATRRDNGVRARSTAMHRGSASTVQELARSHLNRQRQEQQRKAKST